MFAIKIGSGSQQAQEAAVITTIGSENVSDGLDQVLNTSLLRLEEWDGTRAELEALIESGDLSVALIIPAGFADAVEGEISADLELLLNRGGSAFNIDTTTLRLRNAIEAYADRLVTQRLTERGIDPAILNPIQISRVELTTPEQQYIEMARYGSKSMKEEKPYIP